MQKEGSESKFIFVGNHGCLDFINTQIVDKGNTVDLLRGFSDLTDWLTETRVFSRTEAKEIFKKWNDEPEGERAFYQARAFRGILRNMVERIVKGKTVEGSTIDEINKILGKRTGYTRLIRAKGRFETRFHVELDEAIHLITPIAESASDFLCYGEFSLIRKCENPDCILYFYDVSKNHARRWCSMNICGNRTKVAAHYKRHRHTKG